MGINVNPNAVIGSGSSGDIGSDADTTALREELLGTGGGSTVYNGTYDGTTLHSYSGEVATGAGFYGTGISQSGTQHVQVTVPDLSSVSTYSLYVFTSSISSAPAALSSSQPALYFALTKFNGSLGLNTGALGAGSLSSADIATGDVFDISFTADSITVLQNGVEFFTGTTTAGAVVSPYTHVLSVVPFSYAAPPDVTVTGLLAEGTAGIIDTKINLETKARLNADTNLTTYIENKVSVVNTKLANVQTLAETNQLNINDRVLQADFDSLAEIVTDNSQLLAQINSGGSGANRYHAPDRLLMNFSTGPTDVYGSVWDNPDNCTFSGGALVKGPSQMGIHCGYCPALNFAFEDFTLDFWIKPYSYANPIASVIGSGQAYWQAGCCTVVLSPQGSVRLGSYSYNDIVVSSTGAVVPNVYTHVRLTRASGVFKIFINGVFSASAYVSANVTLNGDGTWIGQNGWDANIGYFDGEIKDLRAVKGYAIPDSPFDPNIPAVLPLLF